MNGLQIESIPYEEGTLHLVIRAGNSNYSGVVEVYDTPEPLRKFGEALKAFPRAVTDEVVYEAGKDNAEWFSYLRLRAALTSPTGQAGLFVRMRSNGEPENQAVVEFCIPCEPADLNRLGAKVSSRVNAPAEPVWWSVGA